MAIGAALSLLLNASALFAFAMAFRPVFQAELEIVPVELVSLPAAMQQEPATAEGQSPSPVAAADTPAEPSEQRAELNPSTPDRMQSQSPTAVEREAEASPAEFALELPIPVLPPKAAQEASRTRSPPASVPAAQAQADRPVAAPVQSAASAVQEAAATPSVAHVDAAAMKEALGRYASRLHGLIEAHKSYPAQALMRREEGTVVLRIVIERDGKLLDVSVLPGSPSHLVEASVQATRAAAPFPSLPREFDLPRATFELPITFHIQ